MTFKFEPARSVGLGPQGRTAAQMAIAIAAAGRGVDAEPYAAKRWGETAPVTMAFRSTVKAAVSGGTTGGATWGEQLVGPGRLAAMEFFNMVATQTVIGRMSALRRV